VNDPPEHDIQEQQSATEDMPWTIDFSIHVWDLDSPVDDLFLIVNSTYASVDGLNLTMRFPEGVTEYDLWLNISDGLDDTELKLHFDIESVDDPPVVADLGEFTATEDQISVFDVAPFLFDVDTPIEDVIVLVRDANCTVVGKELLFLYPKGGETHTVTVEVSDSTTKVLAELVVHIIEVNDPPVVSSLPFVSVLEDSERGIDITPYVSDEETALDHLILECTHPNILGIEGLVLTILYSAWEEDHALEFSIFDGKARTQGLIHIHIVEVNDPPEHAIPGEQTAEAGVATTIDLSSYVWDSDNDLTDLFLNMDSPYATSDGLELTVEFPMAIEEYNLWINISDGTDFSQVELHFTITIPDASPVVYYLNVLEGMRVGGVLIVKGNASDDNAVESVEIRVDGGDWLSAKGTESWRYELDTGNLSHGIHDLEARCWDGRQWSDIQLIRILVDQAPQVTIESPAPVAIFKNALKARGYASDDVRVLRVEVRIDEGKWTTVDYSEQWTYNVGVKDMAEGEHVLWVRAYDGEQYSDTVSVTFKVKEDESKDSDSQYVVFVVSVLVIVSMLYWISIRKG
jgi:hypothetical protein